MACVRLAFSTRRFFIRSSVYNLVSEQRSANANKVNCSRHNTHAQASNSTVEHAGRYLDCPFKFFFHFIAVCSRFSSGTRLQKTFAQFACGASCLAAGNSTARRPLKGKHSGQAESSLDQKQFWIGSPRRRAPETRNKGHRRRGCSDMCHMSHNTQRVTLKRMPIL
jgi:hypothetical protein